MKSGRHFRVLVIILVVAYNAVAAVSYYYGAEERLPVHSTALATTRIFTMDPLAGTYTFAYDTGGGDQQSYRVETRTADGTVTGRYGYIDPKRVLRIVDYVADRRGYRVKLSTRYPVLSKSSLFIGPIPSPIVSEKSRLKTGRIPLANPVVAASLENRMIHAK